MSLIYLQENDNMHPKILYEGRYMLAAIMSRKFNLSWCAGLLTIDWKHAIICAIYKNGYKAIINILDVFPQAVEGRFIRVYAIGSDSLEGLHRLINFTRRIE